MQEFRINDFLTIKLENEKINIYIKDKLFNQCKLLLLNISVDNVEKFNEFESIDEAVEFLNGINEEQKIMKYEIPLEIEFFGHCSNLQAWWEHNYDTRLLHVALAFPLLKKLTEAGDRVARNVFKEEICKRFNSNFPSVVNFLIEEKYLDYLNREEFWNILPPETYLLKEIENKLGYNFKIFSQGDEEMYIEKSKKNQMGFSIDGDKVDRVIFYNCTLISNQDWNWIIKKLTNFESLKILGIEKCNLIKLPESIGGLTKLEVLNLENNQLNKLSSSVKNLTSLKVIYLNNNNLIQIPTVFYKLNSLKTIFIRNNNISDSTLIIDKMRKKGIRIGIL